MSLVGWNSYSLVQDPPELQLKTLATLSAWMQRKGARAAPPLTHDTHIIGVREKLLLP